MKSLRLLTLIACTMMFAGTVSLRAEQTCCEKAKAAGKECTHKCCVEAAKNKKVCEKCNPPKKDDKK